MADLDILVPRYYEHKTDLDFVKKQCDAENADIKKAMKEKGLKEYEVDGITAKYIVATKETMNEEKLLDVLKERGYVDLIKTKEYVDMEELEAALYHSNIDTDTIIEMDKCREVKETVQLRLTKTKERTHEIK